MGDISIESLLERIGQNRSAQFSFIEDMYYKLSNIAKRQTLENAFDARMQYPNLYWAKPLINGLNEETLSVIISERPDRIVPAIWGILPEDYVDDWNTFQKVTNTLNIHKNEISSNLWYAEALRKRRCLILVTGFFTSFLHMGEVYPFHVGAISRRPFALAGIYNVLEDGFLTCSLLTTRANGFMQQIQNLGFDMPTYISKKFHREWLNGDLGITEVRNRSERANDIRFTAHAISKEFYKNDITYRSMLEPVRYKNLPKVWRSS